MQKFTLYRYIRQDGGITVSTENPDADYSQLYRLVADPGCVLTDGSTITACIDTDKPDAWTEIVGIESEDAESGDLSEMALKAHAYDIVTGVSE